jgi:hypothetical protein
MNAEPDETDLTEEELLEMWEEAEPIELVTGPRVSSAP